MRNYTERQRADDVGLILLWQKPKTRLPPVLWMEEILHHLKHGTWIACLIDTASHPPPPRINIVRRRSQWSMIVCRKYCTNELCELTARASNAKSGGRGAA